MGVLGIERVLGDFKAFNHNISRNLEALNSAAQIPFHHFTRDDDGSVAFKLVGLDRGNHYDFTVPHRHNYFEIFLFEEGGGTHLIDFDEFEVQDHSIHFVSPGQVHQLNRASDSFGHIVIFSRDFFYRATPDSRLLFRHPLLHNRTHYPILKLDDHLFADLKGCIQRMQRAVADMGAFKDDLILIYLQELLFKTADSFTDEPIQTDLVMQFQAVLESRFFEWHLVKEYAAELCCTEKHLGEMLKSQTGKTTQEHIAQRLLLEARRLLQYSELSVGEIGFRLGFEDPAHFGKFFKRHTGITPLTFRSASER